MYSAKADLTCQRMDIIANQALSTDDFNKWIEQIKQQANDLKHGWIAAVDLRGMWVEDPFFNENVKGLQDTLLSSGAGRIGTLLDNRAVHMQLGQAGIKTRSNAITRRFYNEQEWESFLKI